MSLAAAGAICLYAPAVGAVVLVLVVAALTLLLWMYVPRLDWPGHSLWRGPRGGGRIALTFDDGPNGEDTRAVLAVLSAHGARATFFCLGQAAAAQPELVRRIAAEGHLVANHGDSHRKLCWLRRAEVAAEIDRAQQRLLATGVPPPRWFRAPHGFKSPFLPGLLRARSLRLAAWTRGVWDSDRPGAAIIARRACRHLRDGAILLLHDGGGDRSQTAQALEEILAECARRGLRPVTLDELVAPIE
ncbi:MAG: polysaccharide deacetylase family protein [Myxococcales bacterium]|nr:polysaccharide deacetylase family protein [Myxococcota bacterium]MDW8281524.1 polysaccharide deacetylase family protein [Myxococcales bacterium]